MCSETIFIAGRYNKYLRNLSQSPWIDKNDTRIKNSVQEMIEDGLRQYLQFDRLTFSSSGREDVDVRMLGTGRPFVFKIMNPWDPSNYVPNTIKQIQEFINSKYNNKIQIRDLQIVTKDSVSKNLKDGEESKTKEYRALCCCSKILSKQDIEKVSKITNLYIDQKTPIRVLHRRSLAVRRRMIHKMKIERVKVGDFDSVSTANLEHLFALSLLTEAGTYIKEFVHGDFGRTEPNLGSLIGDCDTDILELDVMEVHLDWPPQISPQQDKMDKSETSLKELYDEALKSMKKAESMPRSDGRQELFIRSRRLFEQAMDLIENLSLFSENESLDDVATVNLRYFLVPAYLAKIAISSELVSNRLDTFKKATKLIKQFLQTISNYDFPLDEIQLNLDRVLEMAERVDTMSLMPNQDSSASLESAIQKRNEKIENFKRMKLLEDRLFELERRVDEENEREYYLCLIKKWINDSVESLERKIKPALFFELNGPLATTSFEKSGDRTDNQTITIVKDHLQKQVFGLGYPSHPTVTIEDFISKKIKDGDLAISANSLQKYAEQPTLIREQEEASDEEREAKEDRDDADELKRKRRWDEFKDENPRGAGNRHNMG